MANKKFDYDSEAFYTAIGNLAARDFDDNEIAMHIGEEIRSIIIKKNREAEDEAIEAGKEELPDPIDVDSVPDGLDAAVFSRMKNGKYERWNEQENKLRSMLIAQALQRARTRLCLVYKGVYDKLALGKWKTTTKTTTTRKTMDRDGNPFNETTTNITEAELPPNLQALTVWRFNHDQEYRAGLTRMKKMDVSIEDKSIDKININVVYNKKEDLQPQGK